MYIQESGWAYWGKKPNACHFTNNIFICISLKQFLYLLKLRWIFFSKSSNHYVNSSSPSVAYMHQWTGSSFVQVMACHLFGAKPLSEQMLIYCQLDYQEQVSVKFEFEFYHFHSTKSIWKCGLPKWRPFCPGGEEFRQRLSNEQVINNYLNQSEQGPCFNTKTIFPGIGIPIIKIRQSGEHLIFIMGIPLLVRLYLHTESAPKLQSVKPFPSTYKKVTKFCMIFQFWI